MPDDRELVRQLTAGDAGGLVGIYEKYKDHLLTVACCLLGELAAAEDVLHDVFVTLAAGSARLRIGDNLRGYLVASVANRARDQLRRVQRGPMVLAEVDDSVGDAADPLTRLGESEEAGRLHRALAGLPYEQREAITLHLKGEMTFKEVARHQAVSINTVQSRYRYGLDKLRSVLEAGVGI
ncbi:MAG: sigma-70 family RNA polymerase sigma factor [Planctomycetes bacterium]|nr:sigma-70 family RNA polymerase sigma factor [Planctomycetota bacterium]